MHAMTRWSSYKNLVRQISRFQRKLPENLSSCSHVADAPKRPHLRPFRSTRMWIPPTSMSATEHRALLWDLDVGFFTWAGDIQETTFPGIERAIWIWIHQIPSKFPRNPSPRVFKASKRSSQPTEQPIEQTRLLGCDCRMPEWSRLWLGRNRQKWWVDDFDDRVVKVFCDALGETPWREKSFLLSLLKKGD